MTTKILPQEFLYEDVGDSVRVRTVVAKELISSDLLLPHIRHNRLGAGTILKVQVMSKDKTILLHAADFVIEKAAEEIRRIIDERGERSARVTSYSVVQDTPWKSYAKASEPVVEEIARVPERYVPGEAEAKWNPGLKTYEIKVGNEVVGTERDKDKALAIAAGSEPLAA